MEKRSLGLVLALATIFISLPLLLAHPNYKNKGDCPKPKGKICTTEEDREIMRCCLEKYKKGFDDLKGQGTPPPGQDPRTCQTDLVSFTLFSTGSFSFQAWSVVPHAPCA